MIDLRLGDCLEIMPTIEDGSIDLVVTSPPYYNLRQYSSFATYDAYLEFVSEVVRNLARVVKPGRHVCWNVQPYLPDKRDGQRYHLPVSADTIKIAYQYGFMLERTLIWNKTNAVCQRMFGSYPYPPTIIYTPTIEDIHVFRKLGKADLSNKNDASKLTMQEWADWTLPIWNMPIRWYEKKHNAVFPVELPTRCIRLHSFVGDTVLDPFAGYATTGMACIQTGRVFIGIEKDANYFEIAQQRIMAAQSPLPMLVQP